MPKTKRKASSVATGGIDKRRRKAPIGNPEVIDFDNVGDEDDLIAILAQIKEHEDSERLATRLQQELSGGPGPSNFEFIGDTTANDEAIAKRLAEEPLSVDDAPGASYHATSSKKSYTYSVDARSPDERLSEFRETFTAVRSCSKCGEAVSSPRGHVVFTSGASLPPSLSFLLHAPCSSCRTNHCRGCFSPVPCPILCKGPSKNRHCMINTCCAEGRAIAIFETLGGFDRQWLCERTTASSRVSTSMATNNASECSSVGRDGTGYGIGAKSGGKDVSNKHQKMNPSRWEKIVIHTLNILTDLLPSPYADSFHAYDILPHASIEPLLSLSLLPELLGSLLRNDSVTDWIVRDETYHAMMSLLRRMADCELTVQVLIRQRWEMSKSCGIENWMWNDGDITWENAKDGKIERCPPLYDYFKKLTKQCEAFLMGASDMMHTSVQDGNDDDTELDETMIKGASLCGDIIAARDDMAKAVSILGSTPIAEQSSTGDISGSIMPSKNTKKGKGKCKVIDVWMEMDKDYTASCEKIAFKYCLFAQTKQQSALYKFTDEIRNSQSATRNPKDRLHLIKELAVMATSLPPGIWVRVDEVRNDTIKVMIAGPEGTPYAGGLFEFDCFMPMQYPKTPPLMHLRTTGGGTVRFNPNLYDSGYVCLSLLGTWSGRPEEKWSSKSTFLQVLVSIQSMILVDAPYFNEPGFGPVNAQSQASMDYNREISLQTTRWAIVDWLQDKHRHGLWGDVIKSHFGIRGDKIRKNIVNWEKQVRSCGVNHSSSTFIGLLEEFDAGIEKLEGWVTA